MFIYTIDHIIFVIVVAGVVLVFAGFFVLAAVLKVWGVIKSYGRAVFGGRG